MKLRWKGGDDFPENARSITKSDFERIPESLGGPLNHDGVRFESKNDFTADVSEEVAAWLEKNEPGAFERVEEQSSSTSAEAPRSKPTPAS